MIVVPDADNAARFPAMDWIVREARALRLPAFSADRETSLHDVSAWAASVRGERAQFRLLVTGPRATRWQSGEEVARRLVRSLGIVS